MKIKRIKVKSISHCAIATIVADRIGSIVPKVLSSTPQHKLRVLHSVWAVGIGSLVPKINRDFIAQLNKPHWIFNVFAAGVQRNVND